MGMPSLDGRVAFVSGASRGMGAGLAERFAELGLRLVLCSRTKPALSSGEAELGGICKGAANAIGLRSVARDLGIRLDVTFALTRRPP